MVHFKKHLPSILIILILGYMLPAKLYRGEEIQEIFYNTAQGFPTIGANFMGTGGMFSELGIYLIASIEILVILLLFIGIYNLKAKFYGGSLALIVSLGAIYAHIFTPLGIFTLGDYGLLFFLALVCATASTQVIRKSYKSCIKI